MNKQWVKWIIDLFKTDDMRYEVRATNAEGKEIVVGWSSLRSGGTPMRIVKEHPVWHSPIVLDTKEGVLAKES